MQISVFSTSVFTLQSINASTFQNCYLLRRNLSTDPWHHHLVVFLLWREWTWWIKSTFVCIMGIHSPLRHSLTVHRAKKVVSDSPGWVDFAIELVNSVLNLPDGQAKIFWIIKVTKVLQDKCFKFLINSCGLKVAPTRWNLHKQDEVSHYI